MTTLRSHWLFALLVLVLALLLAAELRPYSGNPSAIFHADSVIADQHALPQDFVLLTVPAYDGAQYYEIARRVPALLRPSAWTRLRSHPPGSYAYQRILLPVTAYVLAFGQQSLLPWSFLLINIVSLLGVYWLIARRHPTKKLFALALALSPAALVGLHFSLAEPLSLLILTALLLRWDKKIALTAVDLLLLSAFVLAREVHILFIALLFVFLLSRRQFRDALLLAIPCAVFILWHSVIFRIFGETPFLMSTDKSTLPFGAILPLLAGAEGYNRFTLTSIPLALLFVLPALVWSLRLIITKKDRSFLAIGSTAFLVLMTLMPDHIWGSITSIGRVITPVYPLTMLLAAKRSDRMSLALAFVVLTIGLGAGVALAMSVHPFTLT